MKKSKIFLVTVLSLVLCMVCVTSTTFSWFTRPKSLTGNGLLLPGTTYEISNGNGVSFTTYESTNDGRTYGSTPVTNFNATLKPGERKVYRTDIVNSSGQAQSVSLFLNTLNITSSNKDLYIGVNSPLKTFVPYGNAVSQGYQDSFGTKVKKAPETMRVYFQPKCASSNDGWKDREYEVCYGYSADSQNNYADLHATSSVSANGTAYDNDNTTYFADIPADAKSLYFKIKDNGESWARTQTMSDIASDGLSPTQSVVYYLRNNDYSGGFNNAQASHATVAGANIINYYSSVTLRVGKTFSAGLEKNKDCIYNSNEIYYYRDDNSTENFSVNRNTGLITATSVGSGIYHTKVKGVFNKSDWAADDAMQVDTVVNVIEATPAGTGNYTMAPVITNVRVNAYVEDEDSSVESIYWFVKNSGSSDMTYTVSSLDLTL